MRQKKDKSIPLAPKTNFLDDSLRERMSIVSKEDANIGDIWAEQTRIEAEDKRLAQEYKQAKIKAKELKTKLRESQKDEDLFVLSDRIKTASIHLKNNKIVSKFAAKSKNARSTATIIPKFVFAFFKKLSLKQQIVSGALAVVIVIGLTIVLSTDSSQTATLGDSMVQADTPFLSKELPKEEPSFNVLYPAGLKTGRDVVRISPEGNDPAYAYVDKLEGVKINITQQKLPENLKSNQDKGLEELARGFQATNIIQIDESSVYHGYSEKNEIQSLIFIKDSLLFFIRSDSVLSDDVWVGYILSLK